MLFELFLAWFSPFVAMRPLTTIQAIPIRFSCLAHTIHVDRLQPWPELELRKELLRPVWIIRAFVIHS